MKRHVVSVVVACLVVGWLSSFLLARPSEDLKVDIQISPATLNLNSFGECVTVHVEIPFSSVQPGSVSLTEPDRYAIEATAIFPDNRGDLVAKFNIEEVKELVKPGLFTLTLTGETKDGDSFSGSGDIRVIDRKGK